MIKQTPDIAQYLTSLNKGTAMQKPFRTSILCALLLVPAFAMTNALAAEGAPEKDPAQWSTPDVTPQARYQTAKKEADAAFREALNECRSLPRAEKAACTKDAQSTHAAEVAAAKLELK